MENTNQKKPRNDLNQVVIAGNLVEDVQTRTAGTRTVVVGRIAVNAGKDRAYFFPFQMNEKMCSDALKKYLTKGAGVEITGRIQNRVSEKTGKPFFIIDVNSIQLDGGSFTSVVLRGRLTAHPQVSQTTTGKKVTNFGIAVDSAYKNKDGVWTDGGVSFLDVTAWDELADFVATLEKGTAIRLAGQLQSRNYTDKEGNKRTAYSVVASRVSFAGKKKDNAAAPAAPTAAPSAAQAPATYNNDDFAMVEDDDDLPF